MPSAYPPSQWIPGMHRGRRSEDAVDPLAVSRAISRMRIRAFRLGYRHGASRHCKERPEQLGPYLALYLAGYASGGLRRGKHRGTLYSVRGIDPAGPVSERYGT